MSTVRKGEKEKVDARERAAFPSIEQLLRHPLAPLALVPDGAVLFATGAMSGAPAKTLICIVTMEDSQLITVFKIERMIQQLEKQQCATSEHASNGGTSYHLSKLREDLNYVKFFPKNERYVSLFVGGDNANIVDKRNKLRAMIKANLIEDDATGKDLEENASDHGALDVGEDDFFLSGGSSDEA